MHQAELERLIKSPPPESGKTSESYQQEAEREAAKHARQCRQQDKLLFVSIHVLINLAEDVKRDLVGLLSALLERSSANLLYLVTTFLKKLSVHCENKDAMRDHCE
ncbi:unnamed protein product, partial [Phaeothamnion confervicola]